MLETKESTGDKVMRKRAKILVVEDNPAIRELFREALSGQGYVVRAVQNGEKALLRTRKDHFDLVLTDAKMSGMSGMQLLRELRKTTPDTKVVIVTATADPEMIVRAMKLGAHDCIPKPFSAEKLLARIKGILGT